MLSQIVRGLIYFFTLLLVVAGASLILFAIFPVERQLELLSHWATDGVADVDISHPILGMIPIVTGGVFVVISLLIIRAHYKGYIGEQIIIYSQEMFWFARTVYLRINKAVGDESPTHLVLLGVVVIVGIGLRGFAMSLPAQYDESVIATDLLQMPFIVAMTKYTGPGNHLFQTALSHLSWQWFGESTVAMRLPVFIFGVASLPLSYLFIRRVASREAALVATALIATNHYLVTYSGDARGYAIVCTVFIVMLLFVFRISVNKRFDRVDAIFLYASTVICLYTLPSIIYGVIPSYITIALVLLYSKDIKRLTHWWSFVRVGVVSAITVAIGYGITFFHTPFSVWRELPTIRTKIDRLSVGEVINGNVDKWQEFLDRFVWVFPEWGGGVVLVLLAAGLGVVVGRYRRSAVFIGIFCGSIIAVLLMQGVVPFSRTWTFCIPIMAGLVGVAISCGIEWVKLDKSKEMLVMVLVVATLSMTTFRCKELLLSTHWYPDGELVGSFLKEEFRPGEDHLVVPGFDIVPLNFYLYYNDIFEVREHRDYPVSMLLDHFRGKDTHRDWYSFQTASGKYTAAGHEYQRGYRNIKDAVRIFFVLRRSVNTEEMFRDHPAGYDEPRIIKRYRNVDIWLSTAN